MPSLKAKLLVDYYLGGILHALLKPPAMLLGRLLRRNHNLAAASEVTFVKLLGGGSLLMAYPAILALKNSGKFRRLRLLATPQTAHFGEALGLFDEIIIIRDDSLLRLAAGSLRAIFKLWRAPAVVDLEIHSRLSTVLCLLTLARNRIGAYTETSFWRRSLATHLLFYNQRGPVYLFYQQLARLFAAAPLSFDLSVQTFKDQITRRAESLPDIDPHDLALAPLCSDLARERMLRPEDWERIFHQQLAGQTIPRIHLLGGPSDHTPLEQLRLRLAAAFPHVQWINHAGQLTLPQTATLMGRVRRLYCIDSALLHLARLMGTPTVSYWGPTNPATFLAPRAAADDVVHYHQIGCSPCVHIANQPPCKGHNICMRFAADPQCGLDEHPLWLAQNPQPEKRAAP